MIVCARIPTPGASPMMLAIWRAAAGGTCQGKRGGKMVNFVQLLSDGVRTTDWRKVFFLQTCAITPPFWSEDNVDLGRGEKA